MTIMTVGSDTEIGDDRARRRATADSPV